MHVTSILAKRFTFAQATAVLITNKKGCFKIECGCGRSVRFSVGDFEGVFKFSVGTL